MPCRLACNEFPGFGQKRQYRLITFLSSVLRVIALAYSHLFALKRVHRRVGVDGDRFECDIACRPDRFPHLSLNLLDLPDDAGVQRIEKTPERALRRRGRHFYDSRHKRIPDDAAQLIQTYEAHVNTHDNGQNELIGGHHLGHSPHRQLLLDQLLKANLFEHRCRRHPAAVRRQILGG
jgi:hypothetical protein